MSRSQQRSKQSMHNPRRTQPTNDLELVAAVLQEGDLLS